MEQNHHKRWEQTQHFKRDLRQFWTHTPVAIVLTKHTFKTIKAIIIKLLGIISSKTRNCMEYLIIGFIVVIVLAALFGRADNDAQRGYEVHRDGALISYNPILEEPEGLVNYTKEFALPGSSYVRAEASRFAHGLPEKVSLHHEPGNKHDPNALRVIGHTAREKLRLGYIPRDMAAVIAELDIADQVDVSLRDVYSVRNKGAEFRVVLKGKPEHRKAFKAKYKA